jgi:bacteriorhodopsin
MFFGLGLTEVELANGTVLDIYWARYVDWLFTTPLLLFDLALLAGATDRETLLALGVTDIVMILTGLAGAVSATYVARYTWWFVSTVTLLVLLYLLWGTMTERAESLDEETQSRFRILRNALVVLWLGYPVLWLFGTEGTGVLPLFHETLGFMILDVLAKVGFGFVLIRASTLRGETESVPQQGVQSAD